MYFEDQDLSQDPSAGNIALVHRRREPCTRNQKSLTSLKAGMLVLFFGALWSPSLLLCWCPLFLPLPTLCSAFAAFLGIFHNDYSSSPFAKAIRKSFPSLHCESLVEFLESSPQKYGGPRNFVPSRSQQHFDMLVYVFPPVHGFRGFRSSSADCGCVWMSLSSQIWGVMVFCWKSSPPP